MEYNIIGLEPSAKSVWLSRPEKMVKAKKLPERKSLKSMRTNAFNADTRKILSPIIDASPVKARKTVKTDLSKSYQKFYNKAKAKPSQVKLDQKFNRSVDLRSTKTSSLNRTFTTGFKSFNRTTSYGMSTMTGSSFGAASDRRLNKSFTRVHGYRRVNKKVPSYDFSDTNTLWMNKQGIIEKTHRRLKDNEKNFQNLHNPKPCAYKNGRKFSPMTTFMKSLEDNRIFQRWKMSAYRGNYS